MAWAALGDRPQVAELWSEEYHAGAGTYDVATAVVMDRQGDISVVGYTTGGVPVFITVEVPVVANTIYYFRAVGSGNGRTTHGPTLSFTTPAQP